MLQFQRRVGFLYSTRMLAANGLLITILVILAILALLVFIIRR